MMKKLAVAVLFSVWALPMGAQGKPIITVLDFTVSGVSAQEMRGIIGSLSTALSKTGGYDVIDVTRRDGLLKGAGFSVSGCTDEACQLRMGKMLATAMIVVGDITKLGSRYLLTARILETETAHTLRGADGIYASLDGLVGDLTDFGGRLVGGKTRTAAGDGGIRAESEAPAGTVFVKGGSFPMGSDTGDSIGKPVHEVRVSDFYMMKHEVTVGDFRRFVGAAGYRTEAEKGDGAYMWNGKSWTADADGNWKNPHFPQGDDQPVTCVSWNDALEYCNWRSSTEGLRPAYMITDGNAYCDWSANGWRLPTEAEWEYAARGGSLSQGYAYAGSNDWNAVAWTSSNADHKTQPVGTKAANELGLYDMSGNVWEWCWDWNGVYAPESQVDPRGADSDSSRVFRGGCWCKDASDARPSYRDAMFPNCGLYALGFRLVRPGSP